LGIDLTGQKQLLGLWIAQTEGAKFWLQVVTELKNRGVQDIFIACVDGLKGFPEAIESVYPQTAVQLCVVHMVRHSLNYVSWKMRKAVAADLRAVYAAVTLEAATAALDEFEDKSGELTTRRSCSRGAGTGSASRRSSTTRRRSADHLHDQRHRVGEHEFAQDHEEPRGVPQ
jgi:transposase-like protein